MARGHFDTTGWVDTIPLSGVVDQGFEELGAGRKMKLLVDPTLCVRRGGAAERPHPFDARSGHNDPHQEKRY